MNTSNPLPQVLGWLLGGLSLFIVLGNLISLLFHPSLHFLVVGYSSVLNAGFTFLAGLTNLSWFSVSFFEQHLIIILMICYAVLIDRYRENRKYVTYAALLILCFALCTVLFGIIPDSFFLLPTVVAIVAVLFPLYLEKAGDARVRGYSGNLIGITVFFLTLATINYVLTSF